MRPRARSPSCPLATPLSFCPVSRFAPPSPTVRTSLLLSDDVCRRCNLACDRLFTLVKFLLAPFWRPGTYVPHCPPVATPLQERKVFIAVLCHHGATNGLCIMNTFFQHKRIHKYTWYRDFLGQRSLIDFCIVSADLFSTVSDVRVKRGAELSTDHHLVVCTLKALKPLKKRKTFRPRETYRIKWE